MARDGSLEVWKCKHHPLIPIFALHILAIVIVVAIAYRRTAHYNSDRSTAMSRRSKGRFMELWMMKHGWDALAGWDLDGFVPERCPYPEDAQLVAGTAYALSTLCSDGLDGFYSIYPGTMAPEAASVLKRIGYAEMAEVLEQCNSTLCGEEFVRDSDQREALYKEKEEQFEQFERYFDQEMFKVYSEIQQSLQAMLYRALDDDARNEIIAEMSSAERDILRDELAVEEP